MVGYGVLSLDRTEEEGGLDESFWAAELSHRSIQ